MRNLSYCLIRKDETGSLCLRVNYFLLLFVDASLGVRHCKKVDSRQFASEVVHISLTKVVYTSSELITLCFSKLKAIFNICPYSSKYVIFSASKTLLSRKFFYYYTMNGIQSVYNP